MGKSSSVPHFFCNVHADRSGEEDFVPHFFCNVHAGGIALPLILPQWSICLQSFASVFISDRSCVQSARGAGGREASLQLGEATICQQRMVKSCHIYIYIYIPFMCEMPGGGI